jgi:probable HAF family extracellular repeat protein
MQNLGVLPIPGGGGSSAVAINNATQVVGGSIIRGGLGRAFLWDRAHGMVDLNFLIPGGNGFVMLGALGINAQGQIIAAGNDNNDPITNGPPNSVFLPTPNPPALTFAVDKTAQVRVSRSGFRGNYASFTLFQTLTLKNVGSTPIQGPISVVLDGLDPATLVANRSAATNYIAPLYSQYINANLGPGNRLAPGASVNVRPQFLPYGDLFYSTRILAGPGAR